jgi:hypothetical protein
MGDDLSSKGSSGSGRVSLDEAWERRYWARTFEVTEDELQEAVAAVGPYVDALRRHFRFPPKVAR